MITKALKWTAIAALTGGLLWRSSEVYSTLLQFVVSVVATVVSPGRGYAPLCVDEPVPACGISF
jgi:hypothetical protein